MQQFLFWIAIVAIGIVLGFVFRWLSRFQFFEKPVMLWFITMGAILLFGYRAIYDEAERFAVSVLHESAGWYIVQDRDTGQTDDQGNPKSVESLVGGPYDDPDQCFSHAPGVVNENTVVTCRFFLQADANALPKANP